MLHRANLIIKCSVEQYIYHIIPQLTMDAEDRWQTDHFDDGSSRLVGERQIQVMKEFEEAHIAQLQNLWQSSLSAVVKSDKNSNLRTGHIKDPIGLWIQPYEQANPLDVVRTDNEVFNKITQTFAALVNEMELLSEEGSNRFYGTLALFGTGTTDEDKKEAGEMRAESQPLPIIPGDTEDAPEGDSQLWIGRMWPLFISLAQYVHRSYAVVQNTIRQLGSLYHPQSRLYAQSFQGVHLPVVYHKLFKLLTVLMTLDEVISLNDQISACWGMYRRMVKTIGKDPVKYQVEKETLWSFEKQLADIQGLLMDGQFFRNCIEQEFDLIDQGTVGQVDAEGQPIGRQYPAFKIDVRNNPAFAKEFYYHLKQMEEYLILESQHAASTITGLGGAGFAAAALTANSSGSGGSPLTNSIFSDESSTGTNGGRLYLGTCLLFSLWYSIWRQQDDPARKLFKSLYDHAKKVPLIHLYGMATADGPTVLSQHATPLVNLSKLAQPAQVTASIRSQYLGILNAELATRTRTLFYSISRWMVRMESTKPNEGALWSQQATTNPQAAQASAAAANSPAALGTSLALLAQGLKLVSAASMTIKHLLTLHTLLGVPLKAPMIPHIFGLLQLIKAIHGTILRHRSWVARTFYQNHIEVTDALIKTFAGINTNLLRADASLTFSQLDRLAATTLGMNTLQQAPPTPLRMVLLMLSLHQCSLADYYNPTELKAIQVLVARLAFIARFNRDLREACDTSFIYWYSDLLPTYLKYLYQNSQEAYKLPYTIQVLGSDIPNALLQQSVHESPAVMLAAYRRKISGFLKEHIIHPLCKEIEVDLRLHIHSQSEGAVNQMDPFKKGVHDVLPFLLLPPLQIHTYDLDVRTYVQHFLDTNFYNVNTVALYDWQNYGEMRNLAMAKYGLELQPVHLPGQTLEQGVDILIIMRKIHVFTSGYSYNLNNQIFVQKSSEDNKTLNTINIQHIANSIRTHGTGIMNTTVNFTYQFLKQKFAVFSQFLFDEQIKASLHREIRYFAENKEDLGSKYLWERGDKLSRDIKKLGFTADGMSYLDKFRILITEIGNAMGYVRMIRSGGLLHTSNAIKFVPGIDSVVPFAPLFQPDGFVPAAPALNEDGSPAPPVAESKPAYVSQETWDSAKNLDAVLEGLTHNFAEGTNYFKMFVSVFQPQFHAETNQHLKNFYIIIPALTISFVESMLVAKEKMNKIKKGSKGATHGQFTDDGFAIGVAFILRLLDQDREFESLHWFQSVLTKLGADEKEAQAADTNSKNKEDPTSLARLTLKKVASLRAEFSLLRFSLTGARVFFSETGKAQKKSI